MGKDRDAGPRRRSLSRSKIDVNVGAASIFDDAVDASHRHLPADLALDGGTVDNRVCPPTFDGALADNGRPPERLEIELAKNLEPLPASGRAALAGRLPKVV